MPDKVKPDYIRQFRVPRELAIDTWRYLADRGRHNLEGVAYWTGPIVDGVGLVRHCLHPSTYEAESEVHLEVGAYEVMRIAERVQALDEFLLARVHSHASMAFHSYSDDNGCLSGRIGFVSIVVPDFAQDRPDLSRTAVFERESNGDWRELQSREIKRRFQIK